MRVRRHKSARGRDDVIDLEKKVEMWIGFRLLLLSSVVDLGFSVYGRVVGRYTCVLHDVKTSSLHIYEIDLVPGKSRSI